MKLILYSIPNDENAKLIRDFLQNNNLLPFKEIIIDSEEKRKQAIKAKQSLVTNISFLKIIHSHSIHIITGYNKFALDQFLNHITTYKSKITPA